MIRRDFFVALAATLVSGKLPLPIPTKGVSLNSKNRIFYATKDWKECPMFNHMVQGPAIFDSKESLGRFLNATF